MRYVMPSSPSCSLSPSAWTSRQNKLFEDALAMYGPETPDRWERIASSVPGKTALDVMRHYDSLVEDVNSIDSGSIPFPLYTREWLDEVAIAAEELTPEFWMFPSGGFVVDQERRRGVPWTQEEHRLFLMGLKKYGKGDWRSISRYFVVTRTPTQVASHAQKYFIRLNSVAKDRRCPSIHDIKSVEGLNSNSSSHDSTCSAPTESCMTTVSILNHPTTQETTYNSVVTPSGVYFDYHGKHSDVL